MAMGGHGTSALNKFSYFNSTKLKEIAMLTRKSFIWNMMGSIVNAISSVILLIFVTRICHTEIAGIFSLGWVTAQLFMIIGNYGLRPFQASDINQTYKFSTYIFHRVITCTIMMIITLGLCLIKQYSFIESRIVILLCGYKMIEAFSDVFEGNLQQIGKLEQAGISLFIRTLISNIIFIIVIIITKNLDLALIGMFISASVLCVLFAILPNGKICLDNWIEKDALVSLFKIGAPLGSTLFMLAYMLNSPKYAMELVMPIEFQTYYSIIYTPAQVLNLLTALMVKPLLTTWAHYFNNEMYKEITQIVVKIVVAIAILTIIAVSIGGIIGIPILEFVYGLELKEYSFAFQIVLLGGGLNSLANIFYNALIVMRKQSKLFGIYLVGFLISLILPYLLIKRYFIFGGTLSYTIMMAVLNILMIRYILVVRRQLIDSN